MLREITPAPVVLLRGPERALADRTISYLRAAAKEADPAVEVVQVDASSCQPGQLTQWLSPSLFGENRLIILNGVEEVTPLVSDEILAGIAEPAAGAQLVLHHRGGNAQRRITDGVKKAGFPIWLTEALRFREQRVTVLKDEIAYRGGNASQSVLNMLADSAGEDLHELLGIARQLLEDGGGQITEESVRSHFAGKVETDGFQVADAMMAGDGPRAVVLARRAFESGVEPVMVVAAMAYKLRAGAKVTVPGITQKDLGMRPGAASRARQEVRAWRPEDLGAAICAVARADADVKGGSRDPEGAVERCLIEISRRRARG